MSSNTRKTLAIHGREPTIKKINSKLFHWPIVTTEDEEAVLQVLREGSMSKTNISLQFERELTEWFQIKHALTFCNGTASILGALYGCHIGYGDEVIGPSYTYWASMFPILSLGAIPIFVDINPQTLTLDPQDIERKITPHTKAIMVVHLFAYPADMDAIMAIAKKHHLKVIEDVSHAQGGLYKGKQLGTIGDVGAFSCMSGKSLSIGEGGVLITDNDEIYQRAISFGFYERTDQNNQYFTGNQKITFPYPGVPLGGYKHRLNQTCAAMGRVQLKYYKERCAEIQKAMAYFWSLLQEVPGLKPHRVDEKENSTMGGWYHPVGHYIPEELNDLPIDTFIKAVNAEGCPIKRAPYTIPLHQNKAIFEADIYGHGIPTYQFNQNNIPRISQTRLPISETITQKVYTIPWFKHFYKDEIEQFANAFRKVALNHQELIEE